MLAILSVFYPVSITYPELKSTGSIMNQDAQLNQQQLSELVIDIFDKKLPFNQFLGLNVIAGDAEEVKIVLPWRDDLMGNPFHKILHGGVTSAILDTVGGLMAMLYAVKDTPAMSAAEFRERVSNIGTIDMRVDYLRPGKGEEFTATAHVIRKGNKVAVCRMELHNEKQTLIALGTATYMMS